MNERLRIETAINLMGQTPTDVDALKVAYGNYNIAKQNCEPFMADLKSGLSDINALYVNAGLEAPFVLSYEDLTKDLKQKQANIKDLEAKRDAARQDYMGIEEEFKTQPGLTYAEVKEKKDAAGKVWDDYNKQVDDAWREYNKAETEKSNVKKQEFDERCNSFAYLKELVLKNKEKLTSTFVEDERTTNKIKVMVYALEVAIESLEGKLKVVDDCIKVFDEYSKKLGIDLIYDEVESKAKKVEQVEEETVVEAREAPAEEIKEEQNETSEALNTAEEQPENNDDLTEEQQKELDGIKAKVSEGQEELAKKVPAGKKILQKESRKARISPFISHSLALSAIAGFGISEFPSVSFSVIESGLGFTGQSLYNWILNNNGEKIDAFEKKNDLKGTKEEQSWENAMLFSAKKGIIKAFSKIRKASKSTAEATAEEIKPETSVAPEIAPEEVVRNEDQTDIYASVKQALENLPLDDTQYTDIESLDLPGVGR